MNSQQKRISMSGQDLKKLRIVQEFINKRITRSEAAESLLLSEKQITRLKNKILSKGEESIVHGLVGQKSNNHIPTLLKEKILNLYLTKYEPCNFNFSHLTQKLSEVENIQVSRETVRKWIRISGLTQRRTKRTPKHRSRRERRRHFGELLQLDTSPHDWFGTGEKQQMVVIVDDATTKILCARLFKHDGTLANLTVLDYVFRKYGIPHSVYTDKASWFHYNNQGSKIKNTFKSRDVEVEIETQIQRALGSLGVDLIAAHSPQAKGRVERMNGVLQDRLIPEFKLNKIVTIQEANEFLENVFLPKHNSQFQTQPASQQTVFMPMMNPNKLDEIMCIKFECKVTNDNTIKKQKYFHLQLLPSEYRFSWVKASVTVYIKLDHTVVVKHSETQQIIPHKVIEFQIPHEFKQPCRSMELRNGTF